MKVGVCLRIKDEYFINEFIAHYILLGFDTIFIYDNLSNPSVDSILNPKLKDKVKIKIDDNIITNQHTCYTECINQNKNYDWIFLCDADEFLY